jgi:hypothetical protein
MTKEHNSQQLKAAKRRWLEQKLYEAEDAWGPNSSAARTIRQKLKERPKESNQN